MSFNFNQVEESEQVKLPEMLEKGVYKNQTELIDPLRLKELTALIIGAGSVVLRDIDNNKLCFGNPCKVMKEIN